MTTGVMGIGAAVAGAASLAAGLIHAAAAGSHNGDRVLAVLFALTAVAQIVVAAAVALRPGRPSAVGAVVVNAGAVGAWALTRNMGIDFVTGLEEAQQIGFADATAAALAAVAAVAAAGAAVRRTTSTAISPVWGAVLGTAALLAAVPAMAAPHDHGDHDDGGDHGHTELAAASTFFGVTLPEVAGVTDAQKQAAARLIVDTREALGKYPDVAAAEAAGFRSIGDGRTGFEHFVHAGYLVNPNVLDPSEPESLVFKVNPDGTKVLASAMYILPPGKTMADVPDIAGEMTVWHDHQNLCWDASGLRLAGVLVDGVCRPGGTFRPTPPMLHVWVTEHPCGPFAGIEGSAHDTGACHSVHGH